MRRDAKLICKTVQIAWLSSIFALTSSCITSQIEKVPPVVPVVFQPLFRDCMPLDGEAGLNVFSNQNRIFSSTVVWSFDTPETSAIQANNAIGDTIFQVNQVKKVWSYTGLNSVNIKVDDHNTLIVDGHKIPVKSTELGCMLSGFIPSNWLNFLLNGHAKNSDYVMSGNDEFRYLSLELNSRKPTNLEHSLPIQFCAKMVWGGFLGMFQRKIVLCRESLPKGISMRLTGISDYSVEWVIANE